METDVDGEKKTEKYLDDLCLPYPEGAKIPAWKENGLIKHSPLKKMTGKFKA